MKSFLAKDLLKEVLNNLFDSAVFNLAYNTAESIVISFEKNILPGDNTTYEMFVEFDQGIIIKFTREVVPEYSFAIIREIIKEVYENIHITDPTEGDFGPSVRLGDREEFLKAEYFVLSHETLTFDQVNQDNNRTYLHGIIVKEEQEAT